MARRLVPEPGLWRLVRYADFVDAITPQLANPRRLQPGHQLACYVQIYELVTPCAIAMLEECTERELGKAGRLLPLSYDLCRKFSLNLPRSSIALAEARGITSPGVLPAGARFITLRLAIDPTTDTIPNASCATNDRAAPAATPTNGSPARESVANMLTLKCSIPENTAKPWEMKLSRDEVVYDMALETSKNKLQRLFARLKNRVSARELKKWHALLIGKSPDEQLWGVTPPRGAVMDPRIRRWTVQTLQLAGYEVSRMLVEWEIYWRRKGL
jgi:hypothetical protein